MGKYNVVLFLSFLLAASVSLAKDLKWNCSTNPSDKQSWIQSRSGQECILSTEPQFIFYKTRLDTSDFGEDEKVGIFFESIGDAEEVYLENTTIGKAGDFPPDYMNAKNRSRLYYLGTSGKIDGKELLVKVYSRFPLKRGVNPKQVEIGKYRDLKYKKLFLDIKRIWAFPLIFSILCITLAVGFLIWFFDKPTLYRTVASLVTLFTATYTFGLSRFGYEIGIESLLNYKLIVASAILVICLISVFAAEFYRTRLNFFLYLLVLANSIFLFPVVFGEKILDVRYFYQIWYLVGVTSIVFVSIQFYVVSKRVIGGFFLFLVSVFFLITAIIDIGTALSWWQAINVSYYGLSSFSIVFLAVDIYTLLHQKSEAIELKIRHTEELKAQKELATAIAQQRRQVAHDIRSPLSALNIATKNLTSSKLASQELIQLAVTRISEIADDLIVESDIEKRLRKPKAHHIYSIVAVLIKEKQFSLDKKIKIDFIPQVETYGKFSAVDSGLLSRILSNLINNSIEAIRESGRVEVYLETTNDNFIKIKVVDNGFGMSETVLRNCRQEGFTFGKPKGKGLGLWHAEETIEAWGGGIRIRSAQNIGTRVTISLPLSSPPNWYIDEIILNLKNRLLLVDLDESADQAVTSFLTFVNINFCNISSFEKLKQQDICLFDYDKILVGINSVGNLEKWNSLLNSVGVMDKAVFVSNMLSEKEVVEALEKSCVKCLSQIELVSNLEKKLRILDISGDSERFHISQD